MRSRPTVHVIAGPNGAGKTTFAVRYLPRFAACRKFINADMIAQGLSPFDPDAGALSAGKIYIRQIRSCLARRASFGFETTLSGRGPGRLLRTLKRRGYRLHLYFVWVSSPTLALKRIAHRVRLGGHSVPATAVRRRYARSIANLFRIFITLADYCAVFDNSSARPVLIFERNNGRERIPDPGRFRRLRTCAERTL